MTKLVTTSDAAPSIEIPAGTSTSADPIEGGSCVVNAAVPPGEDGHVVYRTLADWEKTEAKHRAARAVDEEAQRRANRVRAVTHEGITADDCRRAIGVISSALGSFVGSP